MKQQVFNPFLPNYEYIPDGEPHIFGERLYLFGSHDRFDGTQFCMNNYICYSTALSDLSEWKCHGVMYKTIQDPFAKVDSIMQAPDVVQGNDGKFYLYYALGLLPFVSVAVSERPEGPYKYYGIVKWKDGLGVGMKEHDVFMFAPGLFKDDDGKIYLFTGYGAEEEGDFKKICQKYQMNGAYAFCLADDMLTIEKDYGCIVPKKKVAAGTSFEGHAFYEASSMRKINDTYYFIYSSELSHELCYATSDSPVSGFVFIGTLVSNGDIGFEGNQIAKNYTGNTHGSITCVNGKLYIFYHRQTNGHSYSRQACAEKIALESDGTFRQAELTSCGLNDGPLNGVGTYQAAIACHLWGKDGTLYYSSGDKIDVTNHPYFTQDGVDREVNENQYIANIKDGTVIGYKYFNLATTEEVDMELKVNGEGEFTVSISENFDEKSIITKIPVKATNDKQWFSGKILKVKEVLPIYFKYTGKGFVNFHSFELK